MRIGEQAEDRIHETVRWWDRRRKRWGNVGYGRHRRQFLKARRVGVVPGGRRTEDGFGRKEINLKWVK